MDLQFSLIIMNFLVVSISNNEHGHYYFYVASIIAESEKPRNSYNLFNEDDVKFNKASQSTIGRDSQEAGENEPSTATAPSPPVVFP